MIPPFARLLDKYLPSGGFLRNVSVLAGGKAFSQAIMVLSVPVLTRLYTPGDFGVLSVYTSILSILFVVGALRYELAIPLPADDATAVRLLWLSFLVLTGFASLLFLLQAVAGDILVEQAGMPDLRLLLWLLPPGLFAACAIAILTKWAVRKKQFDAVAKTSMGQSSIQAAAQIASGLWGAGSLGLVLGQLAGKAFGGLALAAYTAGGIRKSAFPPKPDELLVAARRYRRFPLYSGGSALVSAMVLFLPPLLLASLFGMQVAGWFALGQRVVAIPVQLIAQSAGDVYFAKASETAQRDIGALRDLHRRFALRLLCISLVTIVPIALFAPWLFALIFGASWEAAGEYIRPMAVMFLIQFVASPLSLTLIVVERQDLLLAWDILRFCTVLTIFGAAHLLQLSPGTTILGYALIMAACYLLLLLVSTHAVQKLAV